MASKFASCCPHCGSLMPNGVTMNSHIIACQAFDIIKETGSSTQRKKKETGSSAQTKKKETALCLSNKKDENFGEWFSEVVVCGEMIEYYDISGCYILLPWTSHICKTMREFFNAQIKKLNIQEYLFPMFVTSAALEREKDHIDGFAPEVAWVTKAGTSDLEAPLAIRPTSETIMYPYFCKKIRRHCDLPLKVNQWCNVVRWEFSNPTPFIRSRQFCWQEGHTAFATKEEADKRMIYEEYLAVPVVKGFKSELEKFTDSLYTTTVEAFIPNTGRSIQGATSRCLGQHFAETFEISFENEKKEKAMVWQNSWSYSTRAIGVMVMVHGDDRGLVLPPKVAPLQAIVIPVHFKDVDIQPTFDACVKTVDTLKGAGLRVEADLRVNYSPGWTHSHWEMKGVPLRIEIRPEGLSNNQVRFVRRDNFEEVDIPLNDLVNQVEDMLAKIQKSMYDVANVKRDASVKVAMTWEEFMEALNQKKIIFVPSCDEKEVEEDVIRRTKGELELLSRFAPR